MILNKLKLFIASIFMVLSTMAVSNADISSISDVHNTIYSLKNVTVPIESGVNSNDISSVQYLMRQIDAANNMLNGVLTNYSSTSENLNGIASEEKVSTEVESLIIEMPIFELILQNANTFSFDLSASGNFFVDWGDGTTIQQITKSNTTNTTYSHNYSSSGNYTVKIRGLATGYNPSNTIAAISFAYRDNISSINGSLGKIFSSVNGVSPRFYETFAYCIGITSEIPSDLFSGINGETVPYMFYKTFYSDLDHASDYMNITGSIPENLFSSVSGAPKEQLFSGVFGGCQDLTGPIPENLFSTIFGAPASAAFSSVFQECIGLTGSIPENLFSGISGAPATFVFSGTFYGCTGLTGSIPSGLFAGISGAPVLGMFSSTFDGCRNLTGSIPSGLFSNISGAPAYAMFSQTFTGCSNLTGSIPANLFGTFTGAPAGYMFSYTFSGCTGLTGIDNGIWDLSGVTNISDGSGGSFFPNMFGNCINITSASPSVSSTDSTKLWTHFSNSDGYHAFTGATLMADYASIPAAWK